MTASASVGLRRVPEDLANLPAILTVGDVCQLLRVCDRSVRRWIADGNLRCVRAGTVVRVMRADLIAFLRRTPAECGQ